LALFMKHLASMTFDHSLAVPMQFTLIQKCEFFLDFPRHWTRFNSNFQKHFFGPQQRWLPLWMGFLRYSTYVNLYKTKQAGIEGNTEGEGRLLGGTI
jgi:hypothetical protein